MIKKNKGCIRLGESFKNFKRKVKFKAKCECSYF